MGSGIRTSGPRVDLDRFKSEIRAGRFHVYRTRALDPIRRLRECGRQEAKDYARDAVLRLEADDYAHSIESPNGQVQDVYGKVIDADGWYLKIEIHIMDGEAGIVSCHPAEYDLTTRGGVVPRSTKRFT